MWQRIHITGAAGAGVTSLGAALAGRLNAVHLDSDDFYWLPTSPPYRLKRNITDRLALLGAAFADAETWVLSGSCDSWIGSLVSSFDLVVFVVTPTPLRLARLRRRERARFGEAAKQRRDAA